MPTIAPNFNFGTEIKNLNATLYNQLRDSFNTTATIVNTKPSRNITTVNPPADAAINASFEFGDFWINKSTNAAWILTSRTTNTAVTWTLIT